MQLTPKFVLPLPTHKYVSGYICRKGKHLNILECKHGQWRSDGDDAGGPLHVAITRGRQNGVKFNKLEFLKLLLHLLNTGYRFADFSSRRKGSVINSSTF